MPKLTSKVVIVEFGGQYTHLISRRVRDMGAFAQLIAFNKVRLEDLSNARAVILSGGPRSVGSESSYSLDEEVTKRITSGSIPTLGICYGHQLIAHMFGGKVDHSTNREYGPTQVRAEKKSLLFDNYGDFKTWMSHSDTVSVPGTGFQVTASSDDCPIVACENTELGVFSVQFHPEVSHTEHGNEILRKFLEFSNVEFSTWSMENYKELLVTEMRETIGEEKVLLAVSGGVDSTVAALVLKEAIGDKLHLVFVNHGLLRLNEASEVQSVMSSELGFENFHFVDASEQFLNNLKGVENPEEKRKIIGYTFIEVFEKWAEKLINQFGKFKFLGQGTIYSDRVESGVAGSGTAKIKSHHNLTLPDKMNMEIIEPLKDLYKDEVRKLGMILDAPPHLINRYPFPGPGLAVRILGEVTKEKVRILQQADSIFQEEIEGAPDVWQAFAVFLPVKAVGVKGDNRAYGNVIALRAVSSSDGMTADFSRLPHEMLGKAASRIINNIPEITRVVYDISTKPPATIEWE